MASNFHEAIFPYCVILTSESTNLFDKFVLDNRKMNELKIIIRNLIFNTSNTEAISNWSIVSKYIGFVIVKISVP